MMNILKRIKAWADEPQQVQYHPLHVSYISNNKKGGSVTGEILLLLEHGKNIRQLREIILEELKKEAPNEEYCDPVIMSITELSWSLYMSLNVKE